MISKRPCRSPDSGFSLLEVMVAMAILAIALAAIASSQGASIISGARTQRVVVASLLVKGIVLDIEQEYREEGFPSNSLEGRDCEVPSEFDDAFDCEYDLKMIDIQAEDMQAMLEQALSGIAGGLDPSSLSGGGGRGVDLQSVMQNEAVSGVLSQIGALAPLLMSPDGDKVLALCGVDLMKMLQSVGMLVTFVPQVVQIAADNTRQLTVRLSWKEGPAGKRQMKIVTYITGMPEEQVQEMNEQQDLVTGGDPGAWIQSLGGEEGGRKGGGGRGGGGGHGGGGGGGR